VRVFADAVHAEHEAVDVLINNAGVGWAAGSRHLARDWQWILSINLWGVIHGCHFFLPPMVRRGRGGHVVNVSSAAGFLATAQLAAYSATKFASSASPRRCARSSAARHRGHTVCPGIINTPITTSAPMRGRWRRPKRARRWSSSTPPNYGPERGEEILKAIARRRAVAPISPRRG